MKETNVPENGRLELQPLIPYLDSKKKILYGLILISGICLYMLSGTGVSLSSGFMDDGDILWDDTSLLDGWD